MPAGDEARASATSCARWPTPASEETRQPGLPAVPALTGRRRRRLATPGAMVTTRSLVSPDRPTRCSRQALRDKLQRRNEVGGSLGELEPLAMRLGLMQNTLKPRFREPQLLVFAADHGLAVDGIARRRSAARRTRPVRQLLARPAAADGVRARAAARGDGGRLRHGREPAARTTACSMRKIAHGTRNARVTAAMSVEQAHAGDARRHGDRRHSCAATCMICAGVGVGAHESAALVLSRLTDCPVRDLLVAGAARWTPTSSRTCWPSLQACAGAAPRRRRPGGGAGGLRRLRGRGDGRRDADGRQQAPPADDRRHGRPAPR
ncbi:MAG: nicotinate-nucleotide--dimethylbenzimidazole phosphoribosyltransferase [Comamonadaceae bacterium]|nr:nicotinate-nucleotide--dimethylbenzimidazole phosphoribosyltransferase [Comamonadaceae bacterium]